MKKIAVIYKSKYGAANRYARWLAEELGAELFEESQIPSTVLGEFDLILYGAGIYAGKIRHIKFLHKCKCHHVVLFSVGLEDPATTSYAGLEKQVHGIKGLEKAKIFHLRGALNKNKLHFFDKKIISWLLSANKNPDQMNEMQKLLSSEEKIDFVKRENLAPIIDYVKSLGIAAR